MVAVGSLSTEIPNNRQINGELGLFSGQPSFEPEHCMILVDRMRLYYTALSGPEKGLVLTAHKRRKGHYSIIWQGLLQWPCVSKELLAALFFKLQMRMPRMNSYALLAISISSGRARGSASSSVSMISQLYFLR